MQQSISGPTVVPIPSSTLLPSFPLTLNQHQAYCNMFTCTQSHCALDCDVKQLDHTLFSPAPEATKKWLKEHSEDFCFTTITTQCRKFKEAVGRHLFK